MAKYESLRKVVEAGPPLAGSMQRLKQAQELARVLDTRVQAVRNEKN